jgi:hypothetical protein
MPQNEAPPIMRLIFKFGDVSGYLQRGHHSRMRPQSGSSPAISNNVKHFAENKAA